MICAAAAFSIHAATTCLPTNLIGDGSGRIENSYAMGSVRGQFAGGLVGVVRNPCPECDWEYTPIVNSYSTAGTDTNMGMLTVIIPGGGVISLSKIPAGRYIVDVGRAGAGVGSSAVVVR